jgi:hypothetical protein
MCFEVPTLVPPGGIINGNKAGYDDDDDLGIMDIDENDGKSGIYVWLSSNSGVVLQKLYLMYCSLDFYLMVHAINSQQGFSLALNCVTQSSIWPYVMHIGMI